MSNSWQPLDTYVYISLRALINSIFSYAYCYIIYIYVINLIYLNSANKWQLCLEIFFAVSLYQPIYNYIHSVVFY